MISKIGYQSKVTFGRDFSVALNSTRQHQPDSIVGLDKKADDVRPVEREILDALKKDVINECGGLSWTQKNALGNRLHWALLNTIIPELENSELTCKELAERLKAIELPIKPSRFV